MIIRKRHVRHIAELAAALVLAAIFTAIWLAIYAGIGEAIAAGGRAFRLAFFNQ